MPIYELTDSSIVEIPTTTFSRENKHERADIQRILRDQITVVDSECMVLAEKFGDWDDSRRRSDLLCLDKSVNLVVVALKRTEDGGRMELQGDLEGPLLRPLHINGRARAARRHLSPDMVDRILKKYAKRIGRPHSISAHSIRATFITTALQNGASLEDVQREIGHADPTTTKLYDRRGHTPEKSASFLANY